MLKADIKDLTVCYFLQTGNIIGVQRSPEGAMHVFVNGCDLGPAVFGVPEVCIQRLGGRSDINFMRRKWVVCLKNYIYRSKSA